MNQDNQEKLSIWKTWLIKKLLNNDSSKEEILNLIANGKTSKEISEALFIAKTTVDTHRKNLMNKLNQKNIASLVKYAVENGYAGENF